MFEARVDMNSKEHQTQNWLPDELIIEIFSFLPLEDFAQICLVCKDWVCQTSHFWNEQWLNGFDLKYQMRIANQDILWKKIAARYGHLEIEINSTNWKNTVKEARSYRWECVKIDKQIINLHGSWESEQIRLNFNNQQIETFG